MRLRGFAVLALAALLLLAGCGGGGMPATADAASSLVHPAWWREAPATVRAGVYVGQANGSSDGIVFRYRAAERRNQAPACSIASQNFSQSQIAADAAGNLYSPNVATGAVDVYGPACGNLIASVADPYGAPLDVAAHASGFYAAGGTTVAACTLNGCSSALTDPSIFQLETVAVDSHGNVWASYYGQSSGPSLIVWPGGVMPGRVVTGYVNQNTPGGLLFDRQDRLISVQTLFTHVYTYRCSAAKATCRNTAIFSLQAASLFGALNARNTNFQATDYANDSVDVYAYPGFTYEYSYNRGLLPGYSVQGIAQAR